jgi:hypothetical protein
MTNRQTEIQRRWDLWHLKTLFPDWGEAERETLLRDGAALDARQQQLFGDPAAASRRFGPRARQVLRDHPDLSRGLTISLHLGPYSLAPVPWLAAGQDVHVLVNRSSLREIGPVYDGLRGAVKLPGQVIWEPIDGPRFALRLLHALRRGRPVFAFLDGNDGLDGCEGTLREGVVHRLPGRAIRVRTGLARLALRLRCPVHSLVTVWDQDGDFQWQRGPSWHWPAATEPAVATGELFAWAFTVIRRHPAQWRAWNMLTGVCDDFRHEAAPPAAPVNAPDDLWAVLLPANRDRLLVWRRPAAIWPGDMLEDVTGNCFYEAEGLRPIEVERLAALPGFTAAAAGAWFGPDWPATHLPRLLALGFVGFSAAATPRQGAGSASPPDSQVDPPSILA